MGPRHTNAPPAMTVGKLRVIGMAILAGPALFGIVIAVMMSMDIAPLGQDQSPIAPEQGALFTWIGVGAALISIPTAFFLRNMRWRTVSGTPAEDQLNPFAAGAILFMGVLEGPTLLNLVFWMLTGDMTSPLAAAVPWAVSAASLPTQHMLDNLVSRANG